MMGHTCERMRLKLHHSVGAHGLCQPTAWGPQGGRARSCSTHLSIAVKPYTHIGFRYGLWGLGKYESVSKKHTICINNIFDMRVMKNVYTINAVGTSQFSRESENVESV